MLVAKIGLFAEKTKELGDKTRKMGVIWTFSDGK